MWLADRGLQGVDIVVSDDYAGLRRATEEQFQGCTWQRCQTHFMRTVLDRCPKRHRSALHEQLKDALEAPDKPEARRRMEQLIEEFQARVPKAMNTIEAGFEDAIAVLGLPRRYQKTFRTTNMIDRLNQELRRREGVIRIFPNNRSASRLTGAVLMEIHEDWITGNRCPEMKKFHQWKEGQQNPEDDEASEVRAA